MKTVVDNLQAEITRLKSLLGELARHSSVKRWHNPAYDNFTYLGGHYRWEPLNESGRQVQGRLLEEYRRFSCTLHALLREQPEATLQELEAADKEIQEVVQQQGSLYNHELTHYFQAALTAMDAEIQLLNRLHGGSDGSPLFVPDTNALIFNPALEKWQFDGVPCFTIVLTPPVLSELDSLKTNHRVESVRQKSEQLIRQIKEYRRRAASAGRTLLDGVPIVKGVCDLVAIATEPKMEHSLPWLDASNHDDRILAAVIEVMRLKPCSSVLVVTRDLNLQNKADFAKIPFLEPPDPV